MATIPIKQTWQSYDDDAARNWVPGSYSNVRQPTSAKTLSGLMGGINHMAAKTPRPMFAESRQLSAADSTGADPLYAWRYEDGIRNGRTYTITVVAVPRTAGSGNASVNHWSSATHYDSDATGGLWNITVGSVTKYTHAYTETFRVDRGVESNAEIWDGVSTFNGYTILHVGVQEDPLYSLDTTTHLYCDPNQAKKAGKILADAAEAARATFHALRSSNLPMVMQWCDQNPQTGAQRLHTNVGYANLFDSSTGTRTSDTPGSTYDAQYCARGTLDQRAQANVKVVCRILCNTTTATTDVTNVLFWGPLTNCIIPVSANGVLEWCGNADHFLYLDANVAGSLGTTAANKIDILASVPASGDVINWKGIRCWVDYE